MSKKYVMFRIELVNGIEEWEENYLCVEEEKLDEVLALIDEGTFVDYLDYYTANLLTRQHCRLADFCRKEGWETPMEQLYTLMKEDDYLDEEDIEEMDEALKNKDFSPYQLEKIMEYISGYGVIYECTYEEDDIYDEDEVPDCVHKKDFISLITYK